jgi:hypothetical protein
MIGMLAAILLFFGGVPLAVRTVAEKSGVSAKADPSLAVDSEATYQDLGRAADLLQAGSEASAKELIDSRREEALVVNPGGHGAGALAVFSPTTLLMRLGKVMTDHAVAVAARGDRQDAFAWLERCRNLSGQVLATPAPSLAALQVSRYLDRTAGEAEVAVLAKVGENTRAAVVAAREKALDGYWRSVMLRRISSQRSEWAIREWSKTSVQLSPETRDQEERRFALDLMQVYQRERRQERIS